MSTSSNPARIKHTVSILMATTYSNTDISAYYFSAVLDAFDEEVEGVSLPVWDSASPVAKNRVLKPDVPHSDAGAVDQAECQKYARLAGLDHLQQLAASVLRTSYNDTLHEPKPYQRRIALVSDGDCHTGS
ncbi:hypothetical protein F443_16069 [Phytophthora nicotianae P1569]|uniref:Uncharacterized protein n=1 Tax=Phytophthora nicotianae P1569 TaxID=1317065 RepID=V9EJ80_PHYNI|nr:hypothetical protein F443_16069 [Phytophthora nicotianae P1569]